MNFLCSAFDLCAPGRFGSETAVTLKWIAVELHMGTWTLMANRLSHNPAPLDFQLDLNLCPK
ncbi:MAG: hypothetical protein EXS31_14600 [Pedosphaera sp.]|nr:hypothetical protein [Pedosphaera sp.]